MLASCSFDRTAAVWEEIVGESNDKQRGLSHWVSTKMKTKRPVLFNFIDLIIYAILCESAVEDAEHFEKVLCVDMSRKSSYLLPSD